MSRGNARTPENFGAKTPGFVAPDARRPENVTLSYLLQRPYEGGNALLNIHKPEIAKFVERYRNHILPGSTLKVSPAGTERTP